LRQQYFAAPPQIVSLTPASGGYTLRIELNIDSAANPDDIQYDLSVVNSAGEWLVDDVSCAGEPQTSAYQQPTAPDWTCS
jgi:ABC-type transporter MlaC component